MAMKKSADLSKRDANKLAKLTDRSKDATLTPDQKRKAREDRNVLMLSLRRAGWPLPPIARAAGNITISVAREQIVVMPMDTPSVEVTSPDGERVTPAPLPEEEGFGTLTDSEVEQLQALAPAAHNFNFAKGPETEENQASHQLDLLVAQFYENDRLPTDMAKAIRTSNSRIRQRIKRGREALAAQ